MNQGGGVRLVPGLAGLRAGQTVAGRYRVEELMGSGAAGVVVSARNIHLREQVTLKIFSSYTDGQEELLQRRLKKARLAARLQSAHVSRIVDIGVTEDGAPYVATEAFDGATLEAELEARGRVPVEEAARWVLEACEGLAEAHAAGLIHGDLKPQNIFLAEPRVKRGHARRAPDSQSPGARDGERDTRVLKLLDFGTTSPLDAIGDQSASAFFGSPAFLAPEQIQDPASVDARADVWALGVLLYNLISGTLPFEAETLSGVIVAVVYDAPGLLTEAPYELARLVHRCLEKDPANRPQNVTELAAGLAPFAAGGARLSERVRAMLEAPPISPPPVADASASSSMPPVSMSVAPDVLHDAHEAEPLPLVTKRKGKVPPKTKPAPAKEPARAARATAETTDTTGKPPVVPPDEPTAPSLRVVARRRRSRVRGATLGLLGAAAILALVSAGASLPRLLSLGGRAQSALEAQESQEPSAPMQTAEVPPVVPAITPVTPSAPAPNEPSEPSEPSEPPTSISFAPTSREGTTETPLAATPTPLATTEPVPAAPPPPALAQPVPAGKQFLAPRPPTALPPPTAPLPKPPLPPTNAAPPANKRLAPPSAAVPTPKAAAPAVAAVTPRAQPLPQPRNTAPPRAGDRAPRGGKGWSPPPGLPTSREALPPFVAPPTAPPTRPSPRSSSTSSLPGSRPDDTYVRNLFADHK